MKTKTKLALLFIALVAVDQLAKIIFLSVSVCNKNIAWGLSVAPAVFYSAWLITAAGLACLFLKAKSDYRKIFLTLIIAGAASNLADRLRLGCVIDFIDLKFWPVFNLADAYITIGVILLVFEIIKKIAKRC